MSCCLYSAFCLWRSSRCLCSETGSPNTNAPAYRGCLTSWLSCLAERPHFQLLHKLHEFTCRLIKCARICVFPDGIEELHSQEQHMKLRLENCRSILLNCLKQLELRRFRFCCGIMVIREMTIRAQWNQVRWFVVGWIFIYMMDLRLISATDGAAGD